MSFDIQKIRADFPMLSQTVYGKPLIYLDNAATTQKPQVVSDTVHQFMMQANSNIHRGVHYFSDFTTNAYEQARRIIQKHINAKHEHEVIFTKGTTDSVNLLAFSFGEKFVKEGSEIILSQIEHHSNIVPWQLLCQRKGAVLKVIPCNDRGELIIEELDKLITEKTAIISVNMVSNSLGTVNPVKEIIAKAHAANVPVMIDGAQAIQHLPVDVQDLDCDFFAFSGHKVYGPTGIGIFYGKEQWLDQLPPYQGGGDMIDQISFEKVTFNRLPFKFEAGTPAFVEAIGLGRAIQYLEEIDVEQVRIHEEEVLRYATKLLEQIPQLTIYGTARDKVSVISFNLKDVHHYDVGMILDKMGVAVRTGMHCTQPVMDRFGITGTVRASFAMYNTKDDADKLYSALQKAMTMFY